MKVWAALSYYVCLITISVVLVQATWPTRRERTIVLETTSANLVGAIRTYSLGPDLHDAQYSEVSQDLLWIERQFPV